MLKKLILRFFNKKPKEICVLSAIHNEDAYLSGFLSHMTDYVDEVVLFNDRPWKDSSCGFNSEKIIEIRHLVRNNTCILRVFRAGKQDKYLQRLADRVLLSLFKNQAANFTLSEIPSEDAYYNERKVRQFLVLFAQQMRYKAVLCADADERFETKFLQNLRAEARRICEQKKCLGLHFRELWGGVEKYRCDGVWDLKMKYVFFPISECPLTFAETMKTDIHTFWHYDQINKLEDLDYSIYHLKMINRDDRARRAALYNFLDPKHLCQPIGYDYLIDEAGIKFRKVDKQAFSLK